MEKTLKVTGMHCRSCEILLSDVISEIQGVSKVAVDHKKSTVAIQYDGESVVGLAVKAIEKEGYKVQL